MTITVQPKVAHVWITTYQPDTKSNPNPNPNPNPTIKQHAIVYYTFNEMQSHVLRIQINKYEACCYTVCTTLGCNGTLSVTDM